MSISASQRREWPRIGRVPVDYRACCVGGHGWHESGCQLHQQRFHQDGPEARRLHQLEENCGQTNRTPWASRLHEVDGHRYDLKCSAKTRAHIRSLECCIAGRSKRHKVFRASFAAALPSLFFHGDHAIATTRVPGNTSETIFHLSVSVPRM